MSLVTFVTFVQYLQPQDEGLTDLSEDAKSAEVCLVFFLFSVRLVKLLGVLYRQHKLESSGYTLWTKVHTHAPPYTCTYRQAIKK